MIKHLLPTLLLCLSVLSVQAEINTEAITYSDGETDLKGYLAVDTAGPDIKPAAIVVHEWWGHNAYAQRRADMLAEQGYVAFALDMYGDGQTADHPKDAGAFSSKISGDLPLAEKRFRAAMKVLTDREDVDADRIVAVGYCFGGSTVLNMARLGVELKAVASVHGGLDAGVTTQPDTMKARILVCHGGGDVLIPADKVEAFRKEMDAANADYDIKIYPDALHSFSNPDADAFAEKFGMPIGYQEAADTASWNDILAFFAETVKSD